MVFQCNCSEDKFRIEKFPDGTISFTCTCCGDRFDISQVVEDLNEEVDSSKERR